MIFGVVLLRQRGNIMIPHEQPTVRITVDWWCHPNNERGKQQHDRTERKMCQNRIIVIIIIVVVSSDKLTKSSSLKSCSSSSSSSSRRRSEWVPVLLLLLLLLVLLLRLAGNKQRPVSLLGSLLGRLLLLHWARPYVS